MTLPLLDMFDVRNHMTVILLKLRNNFCVPNICDNKRQNVPQCQISVMRESATLIINMLL